MAHVTGVNSWVAVLAFSTAACSVRLIYRPTPIIMHYVAVNGLTLFTVSAGRIAVSALRNDQDTLRE